MAGWLAGPSGGSGGEQFSDIPNLPSRARVAAVQVRAGTVVDAIRVFYARGGAAVPTLFHGGNGGDVRRLELAQGEFVRRVRGAYGLAPAHGSVVASLTIDTNLRDRALRAGGGVAVDTATFVYEAGGGCEIAGFSGASGRLLDAVGVVLRARAPGSANSLFRCGPSGGTGGRAFSDLPALQRDPGARLVRVVVAGDRFIDSVRTYYVPAGGHLVGGRRHGGGGGDAAELVLDRGEFITAVSGLYGNLVDSIVIDTNRRERALVAGANFRPLEPRLLPSGFYRYEAPEGSEVAGFFGRSATYVDAIGVIFRKR